MSKNSDKGQEKFSGPFYTDNVDDHYEDEDDLYGDYGLELSRTNRDRSNDKARAKRAKRPLRESDWN